MGNAFWRRLWQGGAERHTRDGPANRKPPRRVALCLEALEDRTVPAVVHEVFVLGLDSQIYAQKLDANGNSASGYFLTTPGQVNKDFQVEHLSNGAPELFVRGLDNQVYAEHFDTSGNPSGGYFLTTPGQVLGFEVGQDASNRPVLFALGLDNQVYGAKFDATGNPVGAYALTTPGQVLALAVI